MHPIIKFPKNSRVIITEIMGKHALQNRLAGMGIVEKAVIEILHNSKNNSLMLVKLGNKRLALRCSDELQILGKLE